MFLANRKYILLTYKHSISETISLLYQERKLINFLLERRDEAVLFSQNELLRHGRNNPESLQRLFQLGILQGHKDAAYINQSFFAWLNLSKPFKEEKLWDFQLIVFEHLFELLDPTPLELAELKRAFQNLEEFVLEEAEQIILISDKQQALVFNEKVQELRQKIIAASGKYELEDELQLLIRQSLITLKSIALSLSSFYEQAHTAFHLKLKKIKQLKDQAKLNAKSEALQYLEKEASLNMEPLGIHKFQLSLDYLAGTQVRPLLKYIKKLGSSPQKESKLSKPELELEAREDNWIGLWELKESFEGSKKDLYSFLAEQEFLGKHSENMLKEYFFLLTQSFGAGWRWTEENVSVEGKTFPKVYAK